MQFLSRYQNTVQLNEAFNIIAIHATLIYCYSNFVVAITFIQKNQKILKIYNLDLVTMEK